MAAEVSSKVQVAADRWKSKRGGRKRAAAEESSPEARSNAVELTFGRIQNAV